MFSFYRPGARRTIKNPDKCPHSGRMSMRSGFVPLFRPSLFRFPAAKKSPDQQAEHKQRQADRGLV